MATPPGGSGGGRRPRPSTTRLDIQGWRSPFDEPHPRRRRTPAAPLRGAGRLCWGRAPAGPDTHSCPTPWPVEIRRAHPPRRGGQLGSAHGWAGSSGQSYGQVEGEAFVAVAVEDGEEEGSGVEIDAGI